MYMHSKLLDINDNERRLIAAIFSNMSQRKGRQGIGSDKRNQELKAQCLQGRASRFNQRASNLGLVSKLLFRCH